MPTATQPAPSTIQDHLYIPPAVQSYIDSLLNPNYDMSEIDQLAAERAIGSGTSGSPFAILGQYNMRDSERLRRQGLGTQAYEGYLNRAAQSQQLSEQQRHDLDLARIRGDQALEQIRLSDSGAMERLSETNRAALERQVREGEQAMERLRLSESGATARNAADLSSRERIAQLENNAARERQRLSESGLDRRFFAGQEGENYRTMLQLQGRQPSGGGGTGTSSGGGRYSPSATDNAINQILAQYGLAPTTPNRAPAPNEFNMDDWLASVQGIGPITNVQDFDQGQFDQDWNNFFANNPNYYVQAPEPQFDQAQFDADWNAYYADNPNYYVNTDPAYYDQNLYGEFSEF